MARKRTRKKPALSRRKFLALGAAGAAVAAAGVWSVPGFAEQSSSLAGAADAASGAPYAGISHEAFERARSRAQALVAKMTLKEKISQFGSSSPAIERLHLAPFPYYGGEALHGLVRSGPITSFPMPLALGCSWNPSLMHRVYTAVSDEVWAWHKKTGWGLAMFSPPTVNMGTRDPRWGRIGENFSEDPLLVGRLAVATIHAMQGDNANYLKTIVCAKHYAANDTDSDRDFVSAEVDPRSFWEYYSRGFDACVRKGDVFTVMSSYNEMNGIPTTANPFLLTELLRQRWGFDGYVVSDCDAVADIWKTHHFVPTAVEAAALAVTAGCDINCGTTLQENLGEAVSQMLISESKLDESLARSFTGRFLLGTYDPPEQNPYHTIPVSCLESEEHRNLALEAARQSVVLFKNENATLPLKKGGLKKVAVIGPMADWCLLGGYSGIPIERISPLEGIRQFLGASAPPSERIRAVDFTQIEPPKGNVWSSMELTPSSEGGVALEVRRGPSRTKYDGISLAGAKEFHVRVSSGAGQGGGGVIEAHLDSATGPLIARVEVKPTGGTDRWKTLSSPVQPEAASAKGGHAVFLEFSGLKGEPNFHIASFSFSPMAPFGESLGHSGGIEVSYTPGCTTTGAKDQAQFAAAEKAAKESDVALVFAGNNALVSHEGLDRTFIHLPGVQHELIQAVAKANPKTILVISSNAPVAVNWEQDHLPAILGGLPLGQMQGRALAEILFGDINPGGKTSITWYRGVQDLPDFHDYNIRHGRTYMYFKKKPLYPFGHGLSYTSFEYSNLQSAGALKPGGKLTVEVDVKNTGGRDGDEVIQLYAHCLKSTVVRPEKQLADFKRVSIKAGQRQTVRLELDYASQALRYWDESKYRFIVEPGTIELEVGASSADIRLKKQVPLVTS